MKPDVIIIGSGPALVAARHAINEIGGKAVIVNDQLSSVSGSPFRIREIPILTALREPNNRRTRREKARKSKRK